MAKTIRLKDIAKQSGFSVSAVSKALLGKDDIGEETREHIIAIAKEMGYQPNNMARSLRLGRTSLIGIIIPDNSNPYYSVILKEIENTAMQLGFTTIVANTNDDPNLEVKVLQTFQSLSVDGIISVPVWIDNYQEVETPCIFVSRYPYRPVLRKSLININYKLNSRYSYVVSDDFLAQRMAAEHLIPQCGENIYLMLSVKKCKYAASIKDSIRLDGFYEALRGSGRQLEAWQVIWNAHTIESSYELMKALCKKAKTPFGVCLYNDRVSMGCLKAIHDAGLSIPDDVCVVGFDDLEFSAYTNPPLTTVHSAKFSMGSHATMQLISMLNTIARGPNQVIHTVLQPHLVQRESS